jgi:hypothetical protein
LVRSSVFWDIDFAEEYVSSISMAVKQVKEETSEKQKTSTALPL